MSAQRYRLGRVRRGTDSQRRQADWCQAKGPWRKLLLELLESRWLLAAATGPGLLVPQPPTRELLGESRLPYVGRFAASHLAGEGTFGFAAAHSAANSASNSETGEIAGSTWNDLDDDGIWDDGEQGIAGWQVYLDRNANGSYDDGEPIQTTSATGTYTFANVDPGPYVVAERLTSGWKQTYPATTAALLSSPGEEGPSSFAELLSNTPYVDLGPSDNVAWDQPRVATLLTEDNDGFRQVGPFLFNTFLLDSGSNSILVFKSAVDEMQTSQYPYQTDGLFQESGVAGFHFFDISDPYFFHFCAFSSNISGGCEAITLSTAGDTRILSDGNNDLSPFGPWGILGMPGMADRVTTLDWTPWIFAQRDLNFFMEVGFSDAVPPQGQSSPHLPGVTDPRYSVVVDNRVEFDVRDGLVDPTDAPPVWADLPFLTATVNHNGKSAAGNFLLDTGAQLSIMSKRMALELGMDSNQDGELNELDANFARSEIIGGIGGTVTAPVFLFDEVRVPTEQGVDLMWTDLLWLILDINTGEENPPLDAVFGSDLLTSGWIEGWAQDGKSGYLMKLHMDFRNWNATGQGRVYFDLNPELGAVIDPNGPGAKITHSGDSTTVSETGVDDSYQIVLTQAPTADVVVNLTNSDGELTAVEQGSSNPFVVFTPSNWNVPRTIVVSAENDADVENFHRSSIAHSSTSSDPSYQGVGMPRVVVSIIDDDFAGVMLIPTEGSTNVSEAGATDTYAVVLTKAPREDVTIHLEHAQGQVTAVHAQNAGSTLLFTPSNWNFPQAVLVRAVDDALTEGDHEAFVSHRIDTNDIDYLEAFPLQEKVFLTDNDVIIAPPGTHLVSVAAGRLVTAVNFGNRDVPPTIVGVTAGSSSWTDSFKAALAAAGVGHPIPTGTGQLDALPWNNIDRVFLRFSEDVGASLTASRIALVGVNTPNYAASIADVTFNSTTLVATVSLSAPLVRDKLRISVFDTVRDVNGHALDGERVDQVTAGASGNGSPGGHFHYRFNIVPGDTNQSGAVSVNDIAPLQAGMGKSVGQSGYSLFADLNGSGQISVNDIAPLRDNLGRALPDGEPATPGPPAGGGASTVSLGNLMDSPLLGPDQPLGPLPVFRDIQTALPVVDQSAPPWPSVEIMARGAGGSRFVNRLRSGSAEAAVRPIRWEELDSSALRPATMDEGLVDLLSRDQARRRQR